MPVESRWRAVVPLLPVSVPVPEKEPEGVEAYGDGHGDGDGWEVGDVDGYGGGHGDGYRHRAGCGEIDSPRVLSE